MSEITNHIEGITGVGTANTDYIESAQRFVVASVPKELLKWAGTETVSGTHGGDNSPTAITLPVGTDNIISVRRDAYVAQEVGIEMRGFIGNSASLHNATATFPKYYLAAGNEVRVKPDPTASLTAHATYVDFSKLDDDCDLRNAVVYKASSSEFTKLATSKVTDWTDLVVPVAPSVPDFGDSLTITSLLPVVPTLSNNAVSFSQTAPTYTKPALALTSFPSITWTFPSVPSIPITSAQTVADFSSTAPTFTAPPMSPPDFSDTDNWISSEEDSEMLSSRVQEIQAKIGEYSARLGESQAEFNKENVIYQATIQEKIQEAQLSDADENRKLQIFQNEISNYQAEVNKVIAGNQGEIAEWQQRGAIDLQKYSADLQNELNEFNKENVEYQVQLQISTQDAQLSSQDDAQKLQKYGNELQSYQNDVNTQVQDYTNTLNKNTQEYQNRISLYNSDMQKYQAEVGEKTQKINSATQNATYYSKESDKYYQWASAEVQMYIQNNSKMINRTMAAQAAQQQSRR
jgi:hypothetical protein